MSEQRGSDRERELDLARRQAWAAYFRLRESRAAPSTAQPPPPPPHEMLRAELQRMNPLDPDYEGKFLLFMEMDAESRAAR